MQKREVLMFWNDSEEQLLQRVIELLNHTDYLTGETPWTVEHLPAILALGLRELHVKLKQDAQNTPQKSEKAYE